MASDHVEPINILAELVIDSANDVLAGYQTWEDHISYLKQMAAEYELQGVKLPLDLTDKSHDEGEVSYAATHATYRRLAVRPTAQASRAREAAPVSNPVQSVQSRSLFD